MSDQFDRLSHLPGPDSLDKASAWAATQQRLAASASNSAGRSRHRGAKLAGALVAVAAVAATPLVIVALRSQDQPGLGTISPSPSFSSESPDPSPTDGATSPGAHQWPDLTAPAAECGIPNRADGTTEVTAADAQYMMQCSLAALAAPDLIISVETPAQEGRAVLTERITAPAAGGLLLVNTDWVYERETVTPTDTAIAPEKGDALFFVDDGKLLSLLLDHVNHTYSVADLEEYMLNGVDYLNGIDRLDPDGVGWMGRLVDKWETVKSLVQSASRPGAIGGITVLGSDRQNDREVVKLELAAELLPQEYQESFATSAELWLYLDDGMPARTVFKFDAASLHQDSVDNSAGTLTADPSLVGWCWAEANLDGSIGICADQPTIFSWSRSANPASAITLTVPDTYTGAELRCAEGEDCIKAILCDDPEGDAEAADCVVLASGPRASKAPRSDS
ncbi:MAG: hypothetical protein LBS27_05370 [Bifidobacteriaceae bacterium]|jgi:hypothetical protein|nr:hypothetical protein [Bifidobacteriaceae bacterium]